MSAALFVAAACSVIETPMVEETPTVNESKIVTLVTTLAPKGRDTKALNDPGDGILHSSWAVNEEVCVEYTDEGDNLVDAKGIITAVDGSGKATLSVSLINPKDGDSDVFFEYPYSIAKGQKDMRTDQIGSLADLAQNFDYFDGSGTLHVAGGVATLPEGIVMTRNVSVWKLILKVGEDDITNTITSLSINADGGGDYDIAPSSLSAIYVALYTVSDQAVTITAATPTGIYSFSKNNVTLTPGYFYRSTVTLTAAPPSNTYRAYLDRTTFSVEDIPGEATTVISSGSAVNWSAGTYVVSSDVTIDGNVTCSGNVNLILKDGASLTVNGTFTGATNLNIYGQELSTGKLDVVADDINLVAGSINIHGGIITVTEGGVQQGIEGNDINIYHGTVTAAGNMNGFSVMGDMHIYGGKVTASATNGDALIVYGSGVPGSLTISGGTFMATGLGTGTNSRGIMVTDGSGDGTATITVSGGTVIATGGSDDDSTPGGCGIQVCGNLAISGNAKVLAHGGMDTYGNGGGYGINVCAGSSAGGDATISGGTTTLTGGEGMAALNVDSDLTISGATTEIDAMGGLWAEGIMTYGAINISGGNITARGGAEGGIGLEGTTTISGGFVTAIGGNGVVSSMENGAAGFDGSLTVNGGTFVATGGAKAGDGADGLGISDGSEIELSGVTMYEGDSSNPSTPATSQSACTKRYVIIK